ncbi:MAG: LemA family protein [Patescibacteria group bacterium]|nr:LemA family protein [Patescibacteria group bacterium]
MKKILGGLGILIIVGVVLVGACVMSVIGLKNKLVIMEEDIDNQWAKVEVQYQRRYDLIPNLVSSVRGYMDQEQEIFGDIADARTRYSGLAAGSAERVDAANELESAIGRLLVIMENYPELKSDATVLDLMTQLEGTENRISTERNRYNDIVTEYNQTLKVFPNSLINRWFLHYEEVDVFEAAEGADVVPTVDLSSDKDEDGADSDGDPTMESEDDEGESNPTPDDTLPEPDSATE